MSRAACNCEHVCNYTRSDFSFSISKPIKLWIDLSINSCAHLTFSLAPNKLCSKTARSIMYLLIGSLLVLPRKSVAIVLKIDGAHSWKVCPSLTVDFALNLSEWALKTCPIWCSNVELLIRHQEIKVMMIASGPVVLLAPIFFTKEQYALVNLSVVFNNYHISGLP